MIFQPVFSNGKIDIWRDNPKLNDQDIMNRYCNQNFNELPKIYNMYSHNHLNYDNGLLETTKEFILHYCGPVKPWHSGKNIKNQAIWKKYIAW